MSESERDEKKGREGEGAKTTKPAREQRNVRSWMFLLAVLLPLLVYVGSIGLAEAKRRGAPQIELKIEGYDPRDPFRGQYLQYRISVEGAELGNRFGDGGLVVGDRSYRSHACAGPKSPRLHAVRLYDDAPRPKDCEIELPADFVQEPHRFYIQQDRGRELEEAVMKGSASVLLRVISSREVMVEQLLVDGEPIR